MRNQFPPVTINFGAVRVDGVAGLPLIAIVIAIAFQFPEARWLLAAGIAAGAAVAAALIAIRRHA
jgi:Kef-type K+ transport system membrane component KefB